MIIGAVSETPRTELLAKIQRIDEGSKLYLSLMMADGLFYRPDSARLFIFFVLALGRSEIKNGFISDYHFIKLAFFFNCSLFMLGLVDFRLVLNTGVRQVEGRMMRVHRIRFLNIHVDGFGLGLDQLFSLVFPSLIFPFLAL